MDDYINLIDSDKSSFLEKHTYAVTEKEGNKDICYINNYFSFTTKNYYASSKVLFEDDKIKTIDVQIKNKEKETNYYIAVCDSINKNGNWQVTVKTNKGIDPDFESKEFSDYTEFKTWLENEKEYINTTPKTEFNYTIEFIPTKSTDGGTTTSIDPDGVVIIIEYESFNVPVDEETVKRFENFGFKLVKYKDK
jgi:hypothetical protein